MDLAERVVDDATSIGDADLQPLRDLGLSETEIMDVVLAAVRALLLLEDARRARRPRRRELPRARPGLRDALVVGRPIAGARRGGGRAAFAPVRPEDRAREADADHPVARRERRRPECFVEDGQVHDDDLERQRDRDRAPQSQRFAKSPAKALRRSERALKQLKSCAQRASCGVRRLDVAAARRGRPEGGGRGRGASRSPSRGRPRRCRSTCRGMTRFSGAARWAPHHVALGRVDAERRAGALSVEKGRSRRICVASSGAATASPVSSSRMTAGGPRWATS